MAVDWDTLETELPQLVTDLIGIPCQWGDQPVKFQAGSPSAQAKLDVLGPEGVGVDDVLWEDIGDPPTAVRASVVGQREFTLQVDVWTRSQRLGKSPRAYLGALRTRLRRPTVVVRLQEIGLALVRAEALVDADAEQDGRLRGRSVLDLRFATSTTELDEEIPYIETARISSGTSGGQGIEDAAGDPLPEQSDVTVDVNEEP